MACNTFQMLKTSISLVHDFEYHIHCLSPGVLSVEICLEPHQGGQITSKRIVPIAPLRGQTDYERYIWKGATYSLQNTKHALPNME